MLKKIGQGAAVVVLVLVVVIASRPSGYHIERTASIAAPAEVVYAQIDDLHRWARWDPFEKSDSTMHVTYSGAPSGVGASYHWMGRESGMGMMTIVEAKPYERVTLKGEFIEPMESVAAIVFTLRPGANGVDVTWAMDGEHNFLGKAKSLVMNMDRMVGTEYEKGLADLKGVAEAEAAQSAAVAATAGPVTPGAASVPTAAR